MTGAVICQEVADSLRQHRVPIYYGWYMYCMNDVKLLHYS
jgi:hypothetical protein